jgi:dihydrofolate reductase
MIIAIVAWDEELGIGKDNSIPWRCKEDIDHFKKTTAGHKVVMGRKTWESIPFKFRPLPNRTNIIITRQENYVADGAIVSNDIIWPDSEEDKLFVIGGSEIYKIYMPYTDMIYVTKISGKHSCDTFWPSNLLNDFDETPELIKLSDMAYVYVLTRKST